MSTRKLAFLITAGPTVEDIDPVRFISNRATGKLGAAVAAAAIRAGHRVTFIHGPIGESVLASLPISKDLHVVPIRSAAEMCKRTLAAARNADVIVMSAAVADFTPQITSLVKLKKVKEGMLLRLKPTVDILRALGLQKGKSARPALIGFALETGKGSNAAARKRSQLSEAQRKLRDKNLDAIVLDSPAAMGADTSDFTVIFRDGERFQHRRITKSAFAKTLVSHGEQLARAQ